MSKENIDIINIKCHDIKHKLAKFKGRLEEDEIQEIENAIMIYDSQVKTQSEALNIVLTEKSLQCKKNGIQLTCIADQSNFDFMSYSDQCSLFGNIIDNAIEAVMKIEDINRRVVCLNIKSVGKIVSVHIENYFDGKLKFINGLPETTKSDNRFHGYGMKSVKMIIDKYGGNMVVRTNDGLFMLDMMLPVI